jgi:hypothetical protein
MTEIVSENMAENMAEDLAEGSTTFGEAPNGEAPNRYLELPRMLSIPR